MANPLDKYKLKDPLDAFRPGTPAFKERAAKKAAAKSASTPATPDAAPKKGKITIGKGTVVTKEDADKAVAWAKKGAASLVAKGKALLGGGKDAPAKAKPKGKPLRQRIAELKAAQGGLKQKALKLEERAKTLEDKGDPKGAAKVRAEAAAITAKVKATDGKLAKIATHLQARADGLAANSAMLKENLGFQARAAKKAGAELAAARTAGDAEGEKKAQQKIDQITSETKRDQQKLGKIQKQAARVGSMGVPVENNEAEYRKSFREEQAKADAADTKDEEEAPLTDSEAPIDTPAGKADAAPTAGGTATAKADPGGGGVGKPKHVLKRGESGGVYYMAGDKKVYVDA